MWKKCAQSHRFGLGRVGGWGGGIPWGGGVGERRTGIIYTPIPENRMHYDPCDVCLSLARSLSICLSRKGGVFATDSSLCFVSCQVPPPPAPPPPAEAAEAPEAPKEAPAPKALREGTEGALTGHPNPRRMVRVARAVFISYPQKSANRAADPAQEASLQAPEKPVHEAELQEPLSFGCVFGHDCVCSVRSEATRAIISASALFLDQVDVMSVQDVCNVRHWTRTKPLPRI